MLVDLCYFSARIKKGFRAQTGLAADVNDKIITSFFSHSKITAVNASHCLQSEGRQLHWWDLHTHIVHTRDMILGTLIDEVIHLALKQGRGEGAKEREWRQKMSNDQGLMHSFNV